MQQGYQESHFVGRRNSVICCLQDEKGKKLIIGERERKKEKRDEAEWVVQPLAPNDGIFFFFVIAVLQQLQISTFE